MWMSKKAGANVAEGKSRCLAPLGIGRSAIEWMAVIVPSEISMTGSVMRREPSQSRAAVITVVPLLDTSIYSPSGSSIQGARIRHFGVQVLRGD